MVDSADIQKIVTLLDVFRFTIKENEISDIQANLQRNPASQSVSDRNNITITCLNLSSKLIDKKIIGIEDGGWDKLQQILFERLMLEDYNSCEQSTLNIPKDIESIITSFNSSGSSAIESQILKYLFNCYYRVQTTRTNLNTRKLEAPDLKALLSKVESIIMDQVVLYLTEPDLFPDRDKRSKNNQHAPLLLNLVTSRLCNGDPTEVEIIRKFVYAIGESCKSGGDANLEAVVGPTHARLCQKFVSIAIDDSSLPEALELFKVFISQPDLAKKFIDKMTLKNDNSLSYQSTLLGYILSISHLPKTSQIDTTFFPTRSADSERRSTERMLGIKLDFLGRELHKIFLMMLKTPIVRGPFLSWLGRCLYTFRDRKKLWNNQVLMATTLISVNDGFLMNVLTAMLHLSEPFAGPYNLDSINCSGTAYKMNPKMLKVDPSYCKWSKTNHQTSYTHFLGLCEETFLINSENGSDPVESEKYEPSFISECFYGTHLAFSYGFRSVYERFSKLTQNINELQQTYNNIMNNSMSVSMGSMDPRDMIRDKIDQSLSQLLNLKTVLMEPNRVKMQVHFCLATASYLNHLVACDSIQEMTEAKESKPITLEALKQRRLSRACLRFIPELLVENILDFLIFLFFFNEEAYKEFSSLLDPIMTIIIIFMGDSSLVQNPHLRARFAEILEFLMPHPSHQTREIIGNCSLFTTHPLVEELIPSLVNVFVSIEMTGEGVQFEQKFSYRRPMYVVLKYLWGHENHRTVLIRLAQDAEQNIDSSRPPLFLRFINLLVNDAIFLLDEALSYMNQLKEFEQKKKSEEWQRMTPPQRAQAEATHAQVGRLARFHNVLSLSTIGTLAWLTEEIKAIFSHPTLVDRIANMLNYFLENLVGPKKKNFNVNDKNDYEFRPRAILGKICQIYVHLGDQTNPRYNEFCTAVSSDGRSYHENLLPQATDILFRTNMSALGTEFEKLSRLIDKIAIQNQMDEIPTEDIPDTFLDPIMSTLMVDPVLLPSSKIIVDRSTIARHLLSDQTDPFNRSPLSMEDLIPEENLKRQIQCFLRERREANVQQALSKKQTEESGNEGQPT